MIRLYDRCGFQFTYTIDDDLYYIVDFEDAEDDVIWGYEEPEYESWNGSWYLRCQGYGYAEDLETREHIKCYIQNDDCEVVEKEFPPQILELGIIDFLAMMSECYDDYHRRDDE